jgi:hypothetical protein
MKSILNRFIAAPWATLAVMAGAILIGAHAPCASADESVPLKVRGIIAPDVASLIACKEQCAALGCVPGDVFQCELTATDVGQGTHFGRYEATLDLTMTFFVVDFPLFDGDVPPYLAPIAGEGAIVQINADGSTVTWMTAFPVDAAGSTHSEITGGTGRFEGAEGCVTGPSILNPNGTFSYDHEGDITFAVAHP